MCTLKLVFLQPRLVRGYRHHPSPTCRPFVSPCRSVETYEEENTGVSITEAQQVDYNRWFAQTVHDHGMLVGLKNGVDLLPNLVDDFDFAIVEECWKYQECQVRFSYVRYTRHLARAVCWLSVDKVSQ